jgi:hypothetical protein
MRFGNLGTRRGKSEFACYVTRGDPLGGPWSCDRLRRGDIGDFLSYRGDVPCPHQMVPKARHSNGPQGRPPPRNCSLKKNSLTQIVDVIFDGWDHHSPKRFPSKYSLPLEVARDASPGIAQAIEARGNSNDSSSAMPWNLFYWYPGTI